MRARLPFPRADSRSENPRRAGMAATASPKLNCWKRISPLAPVRAPDTPPTRSTDRRSKRLAPSRPGRQNMSGVISLPTTIANGLPRTANTSTPNDAGSARKIPPASRPLPNAVGRRSKRDCRVRCGAPSTAHFVTNETVRAPTPKASDRGNCWLVTLVTTSWPTSSRYSSRACPGTISASGTSITDAPSPLSPSPRLTIRSSEHVGR